MKKAILAFLILLLLFVCCEAQASVQYDSQGVRDPMESLLPKEAAKDAENVTPPSITVTGIVWGSNMPEAIVNDQVVKIGDEIAGAKIVDIARHGISVLFSGRIFEFSIQRSCNSSDNSRTKCGGNK